MLIPLDWDLLKGTNEHLLQVSLYSVAQRPAPYLVFQRQIHYIMSTTQWHALLKLLMMYMQPLIIYMNMGGMFLFPFRSNESLYFSLFLQAQTCTWLFEKLTWRWITTFFSLFHSGHTECIIAEDQEAAKVFLRRVDRWANFNFLSFKTLVYQSYYLFPLVFSVFSCHWQ